MKKKFDWNAPMSKKEWGVVYLIVIIFYGMVYGYLFFGTSIKEWFKRKVIFKWGRSLQEEFEESKIE